MAANTNLTKEIAEQLLKQKDVTCPNCGKVKLTARYKHKKCVERGEIYHPCKMI